MMLGGASADAGHWPHLYGNVDPSVPGRFLFWTLALPPVFLNTDKYNPHLFCSSRSSSTFVSDAGKHAANCAVAHFVSVVF
jgi:hypothetical protein